jgi:hypothetical protein
MDSPQLSKPPTQHAAQQAGGCFVFMPEEDDFEPDSRECQLADTVIEALMLGKGPMAASAARELKELDGEALRSLASLFEDSQAVDYLFPYRLEFRHTRRGKPKYQPGIDDLSTPEEKLVDAVMRGNRTAVGAALRDMKQLRGEALELVAQVLEDSPKLGPSIPHLIFVYRRGRPHHPLTSGAIAFGRSFLFERAKAEIIRSGKKPKTEAAVADVMDKTGLARATVFRALRRRRRKAA